jgi:DNA-binding NarL/FixJ family response regulator
MNQLNFIIADDHQLITDALCQLIKLHFPEAEIQTAANAENLHTLLNAFAPDFLIQDIRLGKDDARSFIPAIVRRFPDMKVIALSSLGDIASIQSSLAAGCHAYVVKSESSNEIIKAIQKLLQGKKYISEAALATLSQDTEANTQNENIVLTFREKEVLREILREKTSKQIAETIFISEKTVEIHRASLFAKFNVKNLAGLVKKAILWGYYDV